MRISPHDHHIVLSLDPDTGKRVENLLPGLGAFQPVEESTLVADRPDVVKMKTREVELSNVAVSLAARERALFEREQALEAAEDAATKPKTV